MRERIAMIARRPGRSLPMIAAVIVVMLAAAVCTFSGPSGALEAEPAELMPTSPPLTAAAPAPAEAAATAPPAPISEEAAPTPTPVPTPMPANTPTTDPLQSEDSAAPAGPAAPEEETAAETASGGGRPPIQSVQVASGGSAPSQPEQIAITAAPADETEAPAATPPADETEPVVVRDMRGVYMIPEEEYPVDEPSTVPDSPPPAETPEATDAE